MNVIMLFCNDWRPIPCDCGALRVVICIYSEHSALGINTHIHLYPHTPSFQYLKLMVNFLVQQSVLENVCKPNFEPFLC